MTGLNSAWRALRSGMEKIRLVLRLTPHNVSTPDGRSMERYRRVGLTAISSVFAKAIGIATTLISAPLTIHYLGTERYGLWMTISSVLTIISFADFGIGNGLVNAIVAANGRGDRVEAQRSVSSAFFIFGAIAIAIMVIFATVYPLVSWERIFNVSSPIAIAEAGPAVAVFVCSFVLAMPFGVVQRVQLGYQEGFESNLWQCGGSVLGLVCVIAAVLLHLGLPWLVLAMSGSSTFVLALNWAAQFFRSRPWLRPTLQSFKWNSSRALLASGSMFFLLQASTLVATASDNIILAQFLGPAAVAVYSVAQRLFSLTALPQIFIAPLWPAFGDALERHEYAWARRTFLHAMIIGIASTTLVVVPLVFAGQWVVRIWIGPQVIPPFILLVALALIGIFSTYGGVMAVLLNNRTLLRQQVLFYGVAAISSLVLKLVVTPTLGIAGVVWATLICYCIFYVGPAARLANRELHRQ